MPSGEGSILPAHFATTHQALSAAPFTQVSMTCMPSTHTLINDQQAHHDSAVTHGAPLHHSTSAHDRSDHVQAQPPLHEPMLPAATLDKYLTLASQTSQIAPAADDTCPPLIEIDSLPSPSRRSDAALLPGGMDMRVARY